MAHNDTLARPTFTETKQNGNVKVQCNSCPKSTTVPDKGMGRIKSTIFKQDHLCKAPKK